MKILHLSNNLIAGGAGKAARTINDALQRAGMQSERLDVPTKGRSNQLKNLFRAYFDKLPLQFYPRDKKTAFSTANIGIGLKNFNQVKEADIIHLHWVHDGYIGFSDLEYLATLNKKVFINMHDSWWLSGGCHVTFGCMHWQHECGHCPQLNSNNSEDISWKLFARKREVLELIKPTIICASRWMYERAKVAPMFEGFEIKCIPYSIDLKIYAPLKKEVARARLKLPQNKKLVLFGSVDINDPNKGYVYFKEAINQLEDEDTEVLIFGNINDTNLELNKTVHSLGYIHDPYILIMAYSAADVFVAPSLEDNFPNTVLESIACSTPVVAFNIGGMPDMITHCENGFLAEVKDAKELCKGIQHCLNDCENMSIFARKKAEDSFSFDQMARSYSKLYQ